MKRSGYLTAVLSSVSLALLLIATAPWMSAQGASAQKPGGMWAAQTSPMEITLAWQTVPGAQAYRVYAIRNGDAKLVSSLRASGVRSVQRVNQAGVPHVFALEVISESGAVSERFRFNEVVPVDAKPGTTPPPASVSAAPAPDGRIAVRWTPVPGATAYMIGRAVAPGGFRTICSLCPSDNTTYMDAETTAGASHVYTVVALTPQGASRAARSTQAVAANASPATPAAAAEAAASVAPKGTIQAKPFPGSCLSLGEEGNFIVRLADGSVRIFERMLDRRAGSSFAKTPGLVAVPGITDAVAVATSGRHWLVLRADGTILAWGRNDEGQLGTEAGLDRRRGRPLPRPTETPAPVRDITNAIAVAAGAQHSLALLADGTVRMWGIGTYGVPGDGRFDTSTLEGLPRLAPARVPGIDNAVAIAATGHTSFALLADGTIRAWGRNDMVFGTHGVLGTGSDESTAVPTPVQGISTATGIAAGIAGVGAAVLKNGTVRGWGHGYGTANARGERASNRPVPIAGISDAVGISIFMALRRDGSVAEFPPPTRWSTPKIGPAVAIASDHVNRLALLDDGRLMAWGRKEFYPDGPVVRGELGARTAQECSLR